MYQFHVVTVGRMKKGPLDELVAHYQKLLRPYAKTKTTTTQDVRRVAKEAFSVLLTERGAEYRSRDFAKQIETWSQRQTRLIEFVIAGPFGIDPSDEKKFDANLSLSKLTFPHDMATAILHEQLYRAMTILAGKTYHY